ncbi:hypothetical protein Ddye_001603 [Dipteronia dyeriana]|uniref:Uncharacterized protein n=1 Tax=Dipteronia dyeriana TaxID=168575 RepID=A0AAD9XNT7_9ROSI|nr:hypothetical protein Ddye_001603 [Dipteronia dyeriana]
MTENLHNRKSVPGNPPHFLVFLFALWFLWKWRCKKVFDTNFSPSQSPQLIVKQFAKEWWNGNNSDLSRDVAPLPIVWIPPDEG